MSPMTEIQLDLSPSGGAEPVNLQAPPPLPKFRCHKVVQAARIAAIQAFHAYIDLVLDPGDGRDQFVHRISHQWMNRHWPAVDGYLVRYEDGYESYSPAAAFESGYRAVAAPKPQHPAVQDLLGFFVFEHLPEKLQAVSRPIGELAREMADHLPDCAEKTAGLRKLLEAKDCLVRAALGTPRR